MALFLVLLAAGDILGLGAWEYPFRCAALAAALWFWSRGVIDLRVRSLIPSAAIGAVVFAIWVGPDVLWPSYRAHWLFSNSITGLPESSFPAAHRDSAMALLFRSIRATLLVPVVEELFWRSWLMRWIIKPDFLSVPLGAWSAKAFWITAVLFAAEHGSYWDVGLVCGVIYNAWMVRTRSLGDCILAHAVTNGLLCAYVISGGHWQYL